jgi:nitrous oxide reductase
MKNLRFTNSLVPRSMRLTALAIAAATAAVAAGTLAGAGNAAPARTAGKASHSQKKRIK